MSPDPASPGRGALTFVAIGLALGAQQLVVRPDEEAKGWIVFGLASLLFVLAAWSREMPVVVPRWTGPIVPWRRLAWGPVGISAVLAAVWLSGRAEHPVLPLCFWLAGLGTASAALSGSRLSPPTRPEVAWHRRETFALLAILLVGVLARTIWIDEIPRHYFADEARVGLFVRDSFREGFPNLFAMGWNDWPMVGMALQAIFAPLLGLSIRTLRVSSALCGSLAILTTYLLARELFTPRIAALAALLLACGRTAIDFSRMGITHAQVPLFETFAFACWWHGINTGRGVAYLWAGIGLGFCMYSYNAGTLVPLLWATWIGLSLVFAPRTSLRFWRGATVSAAALILTVLPYAVHVTDSFKFGDNWQRYTRIAREREVVSELVEESNTAGMEAVWDDLRERAVQTWLGFGILPANAYQLGYRGGGMLDDVSAPLFVLGLALAVCRLHRARYAFVLYWWLVTAVTLGVFTREPPAYVRLVGLLPALSVLGALPLDSALRGAGPRGAGRVAVFAGIAALLGVMVWDNWRTYFVAFPRETEQSSADVARYLASLPPETTALKIGTEDYLSFEEELFRLDFPGRRFENVAEPSEVLPLRTSPDVPVALIFAPAQLTLAEFEYARKLYPGAPVTELRGKPDSETMVRAMFLSPARIAARQGLRFEVLGTGGESLHTAIADPFAPAPQVSDSCAQVRWSGSIYWPTDQPVTLTARGGISISLADRTIRAVGAEPSVHVSLRLPRGWHPLNITDECHPSQPIGLSVEREGVSDRLSTRDLRPDSAEGDLRPRSRISMTDFEPTAVSFGFSAPEFDRAWGGARITMHGITYRHGIGVHAWTKMTYAVPPNAIEFEAVVGLSDPTRECDRASVRFEVRDARDNLLYDSGVIDGHTGPRLARAPIQGTPEITLSVTDADDGFDCDHANWAEPSFILE